MKCPKCHYLSFEPEPRCKNCGYGFSFSEPDLPMRAEQPAEPTPLSDFSFRSEFDRMDSVSVGAVSQASVATAVLDEVEDSVPIGARSSGSPRPDPRLSRSVPRARQVSVAAPEKPATTELPLFVTAIPVRVDPSVAAAEEPVPHDVEANASPTPQPVKSLALGGEGRAEVVVRPRAAAVARKLGPLDRDLLEDLDRIERTEQRAVRAREVAAGNTAAYAPGTWRRMAAALLDMVFVVGLALGVIGVTLRWCDLSWEQAGLLPVWPMAAFVLVLNAIYLCMFTVAGGQTVGKMVVGIRVVDSDATLDTLTLRQATYRALLTLPSVLLFGAGFVPALVGDERALHDRLTHTRVVRA
jgi:uncharacterized RDD family membrane protein YckC